MLGQDGVEVLIWSLERNERFFEYPKPRKSQVSGSKTLESYIEVPLHDEPFGIRLSAKHLTIEDGEVVQVDINWDNGLRAIRFLDKATLAQPECLDRKLFSQPYSGSWVKAGVSFSCTNPVDPIQAMQVSELEYKRLASSLGTIKVGFQIGRRECSKSTQPKYPRPGRAIPYPCGISHSILPSIGKVEVIKSPRAKYVFIPKDVNDPGHVYLFHYRSKATLDQLLTKTGSTNHALTETAQTSILPTDEPLAVDVATVGTSIANVPPGTPASGLEYILQNPGKTIGNHNLRSHARRVGLGSNVDDTLKTHQSKPKRKGYSTLSDTIISQRSSHSRATKRARIDYASPETDEDEIEEEEDEKKEKEGDKLYTPNRSRIRRQQPRKQKVICDDTDDDEDSNIEAIARMRRQMEAEAAQHHDEAGPLEQATNVPANSRRRLRVPAVKIEAVDLTGVESTGPVNTEPRIARRAQATAPTMTSSDLEKQLHLLELKTREAKFERQRFELKLQLEKAEREDN